MKVQLIHGWQTFHKWWSFRLKSIGLILIALVEILAMIPENFILTWGLIPNDIKENFPEEWITWIGIGLVVASVFAQVVRQRGPKEQADRDRDLANARQNNESF